MKRVAVLLLVLFAPAWAAGQTVVRVKDNAGNVVCELTIPAGGGVEVIHPGPGPGPAPNPGPTPPPSPPNPPPVPPSPQPPNVGPIKHLVVIRDDTPGAMSGAQLAALRDQAVRAAVAQRGWAWHVFDVNSVEVQKPRAQGGLGYLKFVQQVGAAPCVLLLDAQGKLARGYPLPVDSAALVASFGGN
jgi:hypothetical protein